MPGRYRKIDQAALATKAEEELGYQKSYARARLTEVNKGEITGKVPAGEAKRKRAAYNRVLASGSSPTPALSKSALTSLAEGLRRLWGFGGKINENTGTLKALPSKMPKGKKGA